MAQVFSRRLVLSVPVRGEDGGGGYVRSWQVRGAIWADIKMRSGALRHGEFGRLPRLQVRIQTHATPQGDQMRPTPGDRLADGARLFEVEAVHEGDRRILTVLASEIPATEVGA